MESTHSSSLSAYLSSAEKAASVIPPDALYSCGDETKVATPRSSYGDDAVFNDSKVRPIFRTCLLVAVAAISSPDNEESPLLNGGGLRWRWTALGEEARFQASRCDPNASSSILICSSITHVAFFSLSP